MIARYTPHDLAVLVPVLGRPHHIPPLLASLDATVPGARVVFLTTPTDVDGTVACLQAAEDHPRREVVPVRWQPTGDFARKCQVGYRYTTEPLLFVGATDLEFTAGWFEAATSALGPGIGLVGTNDMCNPRVMAGEHATHFLMTREYVDRYGILQPGPDGRPVNQPGVILFDGYAHEMVDDEAVGTARARGAFVMSLSAVVRHKHALCNQSDDDDDAVRASLAAQSARMRQSWPLFSQRRRLWDPTRRVRRSNGPIRRRTVR